MKLRSTLALITAVSLLVACQQPGQYGNNGGVNKETVGTVLGGVGGAVIGSSFGKGNGRVVGTAIGTLLGAGLGNQIGASLDRADQQYYNNTANQAFESNRSGQASTWHNPDSGNSGVITPTRTYQDAGGAYCREYTQSIKVGGQTKQGYGTACRQPDGSWQVQN